RMRRELEATKAALAERKTIDRAKGLLMAARGVGEDEAYTLLRRTAMDQGKRIAEVAAAIVTAAELLK
ncbi:MAG: ANTAR domain-containing protein, partial [Pseudomonadota bacterium]